MGSTWNRGHLAIKLGTGAHFVRQHRPQLVNPLPFRLTTIAGRAIEESAVPDDGAADSDGWIDLRGQRRIPKRARPDTELLLLVGSLYPPTSAWGSQSKRAIPEN